MRTKLMGLLFSTLVFAVAFPLAAQDWVSHHAMNSATFQSKHQLYSSRGYRLKQIDGYPAGNAINYAAIWEKRSGAMQIALHELSNSQYQAAFNRYAAQGYRLVQVDGCGLGNQARYAGIWEKKAGPALEARHGLTGQQFQQLVNQLTPRGYRLLWLNGYGIGGKAHYAAIWERSAGPLQAAHFGLNSNQYQQKFNAYTQQGFRPKMVSAFASGNQDLYAAIWEKRGGPAWEARHRLSFLGYQNEFDNNVYQGYKLTHVSGYSRGKTPQFAGIWESTGLWNSRDLNHINTTIQTFMKQHRIQGAAVALVKDGRLVFAQGYGVLDPALGERPGPNSLFRVASVSKPITGAMTMKLIQDGKLNLNSRIFGPDALLGTTYGSKPYSEKEKAITVDHLLSHTAGGNTWNNQGNDGSNDPMFQQVSYNHGQLIGWVLDTRDPETQPGAKYSYSNFGYCVLGRVIEKISGQGYEATVKNSIFKPAGVTNMHIGGDKKSDRRFNEAVYADPGSYNMPVRRMDAHGGWIASPIDLMRFLVRFDGFSTKPDILSANHFQTMTTGSTANTRYGKGWSINQRNYFHTGSLPGTGTILVRAGNGMSWVFLMTNRWKNEVDGMMWNVVNGVQNWPSTDLFSTQIP